MQRVAPGDPYTWLISSAVDTGQDAGLINFERALVIDPHNRDAAHLLALRYLAIGGPAVNAGIAAYYLAIAGGTAPPGIHHQR